MTNIQIEHFLSQQKEQQKQVTIHFKSRNPVVGLFIQMNDYQELKSKNLWRIVSEANMKSFRASQDYSLAKIFNGMDFTKLQVK